MSKTLGNRIRELREAADLTMEELAALVHPPTQASQISKLEKNQVKLSMDWIYRIADALGVHPLEILEPQPTEQERTLINLYRGLGEAEQQAIYKILDAMVAPIATKKDGSAG